MPQIYDVDVREPPAEPTGVQEFFSKLGKVYKERQDQDFIGGIIKDIEKNDYNSKSIQKGIFDVAKSNMSPSERLKATNFLKEQQSANLEEKKLTNTQAKEFQANQEKIQKKAEEQSEMASGVDALEKAGASQQQIDLYKAAPVGGKTKVIGSILDSLDREKAPTGTISQEMEDYDKGLTPKERVKRQDARYAAQTPLLMKNSEILHALENENMSLGLLQELDDTGRVGQGLHKLNINPKTGDLFLPQAATPEEQLFVKTVNDFTVKAKDSFGARVTNFELDRFMQRLPTLANSPEGRKLIIRQMQIINQINALEKREIQKVFDQYGVRNIDYADAETKARKTIEGTKENLRKEYYNIEQVAKKEESENIRKIKDKVPEGFTSMRKPDGTIKMFPTKNVSALEEKGYQRI